MFRRRKPPAPILHLPMPYSKAKAPTTRRKSQTDPADVDPATLPPLKTVPDLRADIEACLISTLIADPGCMEICLQQHLVPEDFRTPRGRCAFSAALKLATSGAPVSLAAMVEETIAFPGMENWLYGAVDASASPSECAYYVRQIRRRSLKQGVADVADAIAEETKDPTIALEYAIEAASSRLDDLRLSMQDRPSTAQTIRAVGDSLISMAEGRTLPDGTPLPFPSVQALMEGGMRPGIHILAGLPSTGKSIIEGEITRYLLRQGKPVARVCMDMDEKNLLERDISAYAKVPLQDIRRGTAATIPGAIKRLREASDAMSDPKKWPMHLIRSRNAAGICAESRIIASKSGLSILTIDFIQLIEGYERENDNVRISRSLQRLKAFSFDTGVPVLLLSQFSRGVDKEQDRTPRLSDLRDSGALEPDAETVSFLYFSRKVGELWVSQDGKASIKELSVRPLIWDVAKNRQGPLGRVGLIERARNFSAAEARLAPPGDLSPWVDCGYDFRSESPSI